MSDVQLQINLVRRHEGNFFVTLHTYYSYEAPAVNDIVELGHEHFVVVQRIWHPLQLSTTVTVFLGMPLGDASLSAPHK